MLNELKITHVMKQLRVFETLCSRQFASKLDWHRVFEVLGMRKHSDFDSDKAEDPYMLNRERYGELDAEIHHADEKQAAHQNYNSEIVVL